MGKSFGHFPLVGVLIGLLLMFLHNLPISSSLNAFLILLVWVVITGGLHLDGVADSCDALFASVTPERRLEIMKDPHTGTWGVVGVVLILLGKFVALGEDLWLVILFAPVAGRMVMVIAAYALPYARAEGLGATMREGLGFSELLLSLTPLVGLSVGVMAYHTSVELIAVVAGVLSGLLLALWARRRLGGGLTGDVYGLLCEFTEVVTLLVGAWLMHLYA